MSELSYEGEPPCSAYESTTLGELIPDVEWVLGYGNLSFALDAELSAENVPAYSYTPSGNVTIVLARGGNTWTACLLIDGNVMRYENEDPNYILAKIFTHVYFSSDSVYAMIRGEFDPVSQNPSLFDKLGIFHPYKHPGGEVRSWILACPYFTATIYESVYHPGINFLTFSNLPNSVVKASKIQPVLVKKEATVIFEGKPVSDLLKEVWRYLRHTWRAGQDLNGFFESPPYQGKPEAWTERLGNFLIEE